MMDRDELRQRAHDDCLQHVESVLSGAFAVEPGEAAAYWDPFELRHVFEQQLTIWRRFGAFEVLLDAEDRPVGYTDPGQWEGCAWAPLAGDEIEEVLRHVALELPDTGIERVEPGENDSLRIVLRETTALRSPGRWLVLINPARRSIISVNPLPDPDDRR